MKPELQEGQFWPNSAFLKLPSVTLPKIRHNLLSFGSKEGAERSRKQRLERVMKTYLNTEDIDFFFSVTLQSMVSSVYFALN